MSQTTDTDRYDELAEWLSVAHHAVLDRACAAVELTPTQFIALSAIERLQEPRMSELAAFLGLSPSGLTSLLDRLVRLDLVERSDATNDRRGVCVRLLPVGADALRRAQTLKQAQFRQPFLQLDPDTRQQLLTCLGALRRAWETIDAHAPMRNPQ